MTPHLRPATAEDRPLLRWATWVNVTWGGATFTLEDVDATPALSHYVATFPGPDDFGVVAEAAGRPVGVVWAVHLPADDPGYGFVSPDVPELSLTVDAASRGRSLGTALLLAAVEEARSRGLPALSLSVEDGNSARHLYERCGFAVVGRSGDADTMLLRLTGRARP